MKVPEHPAQHDTLQKVKNSTKEIMLLVGIRKREMGTKEHRGVLVTRDGVQQSWEGLVLSRPAVPSEGAEVRGPAQAGEQPR